MSELGQLIKSVEVDFCIANYRKTPINKFPVPQQDALLIYEYLVEHHKISPSSIIVAGDSAGGGLTMSTLLGLRDTNKSHLMPLAAALSCANVDVTAKSEDFVPPPHCHLSQPLARGFRRAALVNSDDQAETRKYSAIYADLRGLPPVFVQAASLDYIYLQSLDLIAMVKADGVLEDWEVDLHDGMPHVLTTTSPAMLPYSAIGVQRIAAFIAKQIQSRFISAGAKTLDLSTLHQCHCRAAWHLMDSCCVIRSLRLPCRSASLFSHVELARRDSQ